MTPPIHLTTRLLPTEISQRELVTAMKLASLKLTLVAGGATDAVTVVRPVTKSRRCAMLLSWQSYWVDKTNAVASVPLMGPPVVSMCEQSFMPWQPCQSWPSPTHHRPASSSHWRSVGQPHAWCHDASKVGKQVRNLCKRCNRKCKTVTTVICSSLPSSAPVELIVLTANAVIYCRCGDLLPVR